MATPDIGAHTISERARAERLYLHYALALATLLAIGGIVMAVLALGDRLDVIVHGDGSVGNHLLNAAPGLVLCLAAIILFAVSRPRRSQLPQAASLPGDELERRIERAVAARLGTHSASSPESARGRAPQTLLHHMAESLANVLEQNALDALPVLRKESREKASGGVNGDT